MRIGLLLASGLGVMILGGTCLPLIDETKRTLDDVVGRSEGLAVVITEPVQSTSIPQGTPVRINWTASNLTGKPALVTILVESRSGPGLPAPQAIDDPSEVPAGGGSGTTEWDTTGFSGIYALIARIENSTGSAEDRNAGQVTVALEPEFRFTAPSDPNTPVVFSLSETPPNPVTIAWETNENIATARIGLDTDTDHVDLGDEADSDDTSGEDDGSNFGNEIFIAEIDLSDPNAPTSIEWEGEDEFGNAVEANTYFLFAVISDGVNPDKVERADGRIEVVEQADESPEFVEFEDDREFASGTFLIKYRINSNKDAVVDFKIDTDNNQNNGNETIILLQEPVEADIDREDPLEFTWDGDDAFGNPVGDGYYNVILIVTDTGGASETVKADGLIRKRASENDPLIGLLAPPTDQTVGPGSTLTIRWRDVSGEDPAEGDPDPDPATLNTTIRIVLDDDPDPWADTGNQVEILPQGIKKAALDGTLDDRYDGYTIPAVGLDPGLYYVIAYIGDDVDPVTDADHASVAAGRVIVTDPTQ